MPLGADASRAAGTGVRVRALVVRHFRHALRAKTVPLGEQEPIRRDTQGGVMMEPAPATAFKVA